MDASCGSASSKGIDRVSSLPDYVLHHVFSFLNTKHAVRTSALSMRWRYLWTSVANIDLIYYPSCGIENKDRREILEKSCLEFVDRVLILHDASDIRRLRLKFDFLVDYSRLNCWICAVINHNVQNLDLKFCVNGDCTLPFCLFTCHSLVVLKLSVRCALKAPVATRLPNLTKLHLSSIKFTDDLSVQRLFSNCPVLDELLLVRCDWEKIKNVTISIPTLRILTIEGDFNRGYVSDSLIKIVAANLAHLNCKCHLMNVDFELSDLCSLEEASISLPYAYVFKEKLEARAMRLFSSIYNVESLSIPASTFEFLTFVESFVDHLSPFYNLTHLTVGSEVRVDCFIFLLAFLDKMPELEYFDFDKCSYEEDSIRLRSVIMQQRVPSCFNSSLRTFAMKYFQGTPFEMVMIEYVLRNATALEFVFISCWNGLQEERLSVARDHLLRVPRSSKSCNIEFCF